MYDPFNNNNNNIEDAMENLIIIKHKWKKYILKIMQPTENQRLK